MSPRLRDLAREWHEKTDDRNGHGYYTDASDCFYCDSLAKWFERAVEEALERAARLVPEACPKHPTCEHVADAIRSLKGGSNE